MLFAEESHKSSVQILPKGFFAFRHLWFHTKKSGHQKPGKASVFVDKAVNQIITAAESAMGEKLSCKATD